MKFKHGTRRRALGYEKDWVKRWKADGTFEKSVEQRPESNHFVFYDGPPFITGVPHHGTLLSSIVKDAVPRYQTMKGKRVERVWGWDCHGLPAEVFTEKKLGIKDRRDIGTKISLEKYITTARENMVQTSSLWNDTIDRIGRWVDMDHAYKTMDKEYMESIWWAFKTLYDKGKIYEGERVLMYCTRDATPLSKAEVTMDSGAYQDVTDPSVYVKFPALNYQLPNPDAVFTAVDDEQRGRKVAPSELAKILRANQVKPVNLLAWTTTPWTLSANTALAIQPDINYTLVFYDDEFYIVADALVEKVFQDEKHQHLDYVVVDEGFLGRDLVGLKYEPIFGDMTNNNPILIDGDGNKIVPARGEYRVYAADYVSEEDGTGIVHIAPAYGEEDFELAKRNNIPVVHTIDENGFYTEGEWRGENVWEANKPIAKALHERGIVWKIDYIRHSYPHCHRCGTRLMYRAHPSWFYDIQGQKELMLEKNSEQIAWFPEHLKHGRFEKNIEQAPDWNLSRDRFWATAMPVWEGVDGDGKKRQIVVGSYDELEELSGQRLEDYHRPWVDAVEFDKDGVHFKRIDKVLDGWFESGSMPFAQFHYPFENVAKFEANYPGDFVVEYIGQVRAWFYYMHVVSVGLFGESPFKHVVTTGVVAGNDGRKMSKSYGNFTDPNELMDKFSADSLRFLLLSSPLLNGEDFALQDKDVGDVARKLTMIWNMYDFFTMYAEVDGWEFDGVLREPLSGGVLAASGETDLKSEATSPLSNPLDIWIVSRLHQLVATVEENMDAYNIPDALSPILPFVDDASNWFVRRSRRRFWKSEDDGDKNDAYRTLHYILVRLAYLLAPFTPFLAEELYRNLTGDKESIHLKDWLAAGAVDERVLRDMNALRAAINDGLSQRASEGIKVRQPLASAKLIGITSGDTPQDLADFLAEIAKEELNVKSVSVATADKDGAQPGVQFDWKITPELRREGLAREVIRHVQAARKKAGLNVDDRIALNLATSDVELKRAIEEHAETIKAETLADELTSGELANATIVKIEKAGLNISLEKI